MKEKPPRAEWMAGLVMKVAPTERVLKRSFSQLPKEESIIHDSSSSSSSSSSLSTPSSSFVSTIPLDRLVAVNEEEEKEREKALLEEQQKRRPPKQPKTDHEQVQATHTTEEKAKDDNKATEEEAGVYMAAVGEYLCAEVLELSGNEARRTQATEIEPSHIFYCLVNDEEFFQMCSSHPKNLRQATKIKNAVIQKPFWQVKLTDNNIVGKWFSEALAQGASVFDFFFALSELKKLSNTSNDNSSSKELSTVFHMSSSSSSLPFSSSLSSSAAAASLSSSSPSSPLPSSTPITTKALSDNKKKSNGVQPIGVIWQDDAVPSALRLSVQSQLDRLAAEPVKDWHPGSNEQVLDLIHPSLFCYVKEKLPNAPKRNRALTDLWGRPYEDSIYQWLPSEFVISAEGEVKIESYINNLNTYSYPSLTNEIAQVFSYMVPLLEQVQRIPEIARFPDEETEEVKEMIDTYWSEGLKKLWENVKQVRKKLAFLLRKKASQKQVIEYVDNVCFDVKEEKEWVVNEDENSDTEMTVKETTDQQGKESGQAEKEEEDEEEEEDAEPESSEEEDDEYNQKGGREWAEYKLQYLEGEALELFNESKLLQLRGKRVQVIVKAANIIVTKDNPVYKGGSWHVEGMSHEHIVASAIWYYDSEGITDSHLAFRKKREVPNFGQDPPRDIVRLYQVDDGDVLSKEIGKVHTAPRGAIAFPNDLQHQVQDFQLSDGYKVGTRKILCFFVVDERFKIPSSADLAPQQPWYHIPLWEKAVEEFLPPYLSQLVVAYAAPGMSLEEAQKHRLALMKERKLDVNHLNEEFEREFSLCEH